MKPGFLWHSPSLADFSQLLPLISSHFLTMAGGLGRLAAGQLYNLFTRIASDYNFKVNNYQLSLIYFNIFKPTGENPWSLPNRRHSGDKGNWTLRRVIVGSEMLTAKPEET